MIFILHKNKFKRGHGVRTILDENCLSFNRSISKRYWNNAVVNSPHGFSSTSFPVYKIPMDKYGRYEKKNVDMENATN